jgi:hypothetical protein
VRQLAHPLQADRPPGQGHGDERRIRRHRSEEAAPILIWITQSVFA